MPVPPPAPAPLPTRTSPADAAPPLALIASVPRNGVIGRDNDLVWRHPEDLKWFRRMTMGCPVIMGRRTWDSLPKRFRPLPGRLNLVVTRQADWRAQGAQVAHSLDEALHMAVEAAAQAETPPPRLVVMGGAQLYAQSLPRADELLLTEVDAAFEGDARFPDWDRSAFEVVAREQPAASALAAAAGAASTQADEPAFEWVTYRRR